VPHLWHSRLLPALHCRDRRGIGLPRKPSPPFTPILTAVPKKTLLKGKNENYDGTDDQWLKLVLDALFLTGKPDIHLSAKVSKAITVSRILIELTKQIDIRQTVEDDDGSSVNVDVQLALLMVGKNRDYRDSSG